MSYDDNKLNKIYDKTDGYCHICNKKLSFRNYASRGKKGAWEVDHSRARARGGTDHMNNLHPACVSCNNEKGALHKKTIRKRKGYYETRTDSSCYLTTACFAAKGLPDNCRELQVLRRFRDEYVSIQKNGLELLEEYYRTAPAIVKAINSQQDAFLIYSLMFSQIQKAVAFVEQGKLYRAFKLYQRMAYGYRKEYLGAT